MRVFIGAVTGSRQYVRAVLAYQDMLVRAGDTKRLTHDMRGDIARISLCEEFLRSEEYDALLMLDLDHLHPQDLLERLRRHDVDMVTAHYFRRKTNPMISVVSAIGDGEWPYYPLTDIPRDGLHEIACTGFGCVLIKREVVEAVRDILPPGAPVFGLGPMPEMTDGDHSTFGSDYRFYMRARELGYKLWLDGSIESPHYTHVVLSNELYDQLRPHQHTEWSGVWGQVAESQRRYKGMNKKWLETRGKQLESALMGLQEQASQLQKTLDEILEKKTLVEGQLFENQQLIQGYDSIPAPPKEVPIYRSHEEAQAALANRGQPPEGMTEEEAKATRANMYRRESLNTLDNISEYNDGSKETL